MALTILQINIQSYFKNRYLLELAATEYNVDVILINELNCNKFAKISLLGYKIITKAIDINSGSAIAVRNNIPFTEIPISDNNSLAIKIMTSIGPLVILTAYIPPRTNYIPIVEYNKIINLNIPLIMIGDFNAHHKLFNNITKNKTEDNKGKLLYNLITNRNLNYLGPDFNTFITKNRKGKPDIIISNYQFNLYHHLILQGKDIGSDHIPIIFKIQSLPHKTIIESKYNYKKINKEKYKETLKPITFNPLTNKPIIEMDNLLDKIFTNIHNATKESCPKNNIKFTQSYKPTKEILTKLQQLRNATYSYNTTGSPQIFVINHLKNLLINLIKENKQEIWENIVEQATNTYGNPDQFWKNIKRYMGKEHISHKPLIRSCEITDSEDSDFGETIEDYITDPQEQANYISKSWENIYQPNNEPRFINNNTIKINDWYTNLLPKLNHDEIINTNKLDRNHPLLRPIEKSEYNFALKKQKPKTPGHSLISLIQLINLPSNFVEAIIGLFDAITATKYFPKLLLTIKMIFINKPNKPQTDPLNFRPISLVEILTKTYEHIITERYKLYLEYHNILSEFQFGFRKYRSTQHAITLITETCKENTKQKYATLIATRDISKAFDTVWLEGLTYKIFKATNQDLEFTKLIHAYCTNRLVIPFFNGIAGQSFQPRAGVPQGSVIGPLLFLIYVNDIPKPLYQDTIRTQYADDLITVVRSDTKRTTKLKNVKQKLSNELEKIESWENKWKIKVNPDKCNINANYRYIEELENQGNIQINNKVIPYTTTINILGYTFNQTNNSTSHISKICKNAKTNLVRLYRFKTAPPKIKRLLYLALIRPLIEYPSVQLSKINKNNMIKLQRIQNKATRFITNSKLRQHKTSISLHEESKLIPMNIRISNLSNNILEKIYLTYCDKENEYVYHHNKGSEYTILDEPLKQKKKSLAKNIRDNIFKNRGSCPWEKPIYCLNPSPIYV